MTTPGDLPERDAMEHAQLVMNAIARIETLLQLGPEKRPPGERRNLSGEIVAWLAATPDATLRLLLFDRPCPAEFFGHWAPVEKVKTWGIPVVEQGGVACVRPTDFFRVLGTHHKT